MNSRFNITVNDSIVGLTQFYMDPLAKLSCPGVVLTQFFTQDLSLVSLCNPWGVMISSFYSIPDIQERGVVGLTAFPFVISMIAYKIITVALSVLAVSGLLAVGSLQSQVIDTQEQVEDLSNKLDSVLIEDNDRSESPRSIWLWNACDSGAIECS